MQEAQLAQMLEFTEKELRKNMDGLRTALGGSINQGKKRIEEALRASLKEDDAALVTVRVRLVWGSVADRWGVDQGGRLRILKGPARGLGLQRTDRSFYTNPNRARWTCRSGS